MIHFLASASGEYGLWYVEFGIGHGNAVVSLLTEEIGEIAETYFRRVIVSFVSTFALSSLFKTTISQILEYVCTFHLSLKGPLYPKYIHYSSVFPFDGIFSQNFQQSMQKFNIKRFLADTMLPLL